MYLRKGLPMDKGQNDFYQDLRTKIKKFLSTKEGKTNKFYEYLLLVPDIFHLLCKLTIDKEVDVKDKAKLAAAIVYFVAPVDLLPEGLVGPAGYLDDLALSAYVLNIIINNANQDIVKKHWAGEGDILEQVQAILQIADEMIGTGLWKKVKGWMDGQ